MGVADIKKELQKLDKSQLISLVADLYLKNKSVKEFFEFYINPDEKALFIKYRDKIYDAFYPKKGLFKPKLKDGKQAISDFKKFGPSVELVADLMLVYVETGVKFTLDFGDIDEAFYLSLETTYEAALAFITKHKLLDQYADRAGKVVTDTAGMGWFFHDNLSIIHDNFYPYEQNP